MFAKMLTFLKFVFLAANSKIFLNKKIRLGERIPRLFIKPVYSKFCPFIPLSQKKIQKYQLSQPHFVSAKPKNKL